MSLQEYKDSIRNLLETTTDEAVLKQVKELLKKDTASEQEIELSDDEWQQVQEGLDDYHKGAVLS